MKQLAIALIGLISSDMVLAADSMTPAASITRMIIGLAIVLLIMAAIAWGMKKTMRGKLGQQNTIRIVDGVSVGTRERVMVLEVADRWLVVGVAAGQVTQLANLPAGTQSQSTQDTAPAEFSAALAAAQQPKQSHS